MTKTRSTIPTQEAKPAAHSREGLVPGLQRFVQFSAVEGMQLTPRRSAILAELNVEGLSGEERRKAILSLMNKHI